MSDHVQVANTILEQLGGRHFLVMTGAKDLGASNDGLGSLTMRLPRCDFKKPGVTHVKITLEPSDTYKVEAIKVSRRRKFERPQVSTIASESDVYCDTLQDAFLRLTGLMTRLG